MMIANTTDRSIMFKLKSDRHESKYKETKNQIRHEKRQQEYLKNRVIHIAITPHDKSKINSKQTNFERSKVFRDRFKQYLNQKADKKLLKTKPKPFLSAVTKGRFINEIETKNKKRSHQLLLSTPVPMQKKRTQWTVSQENSRKKCKVSEGHPIVTSTAIKPKKPTFNETNISPIEIDDTKKITHLNQKPESIITTPTNCKTPVNNYVSPFVTISRGVRTTSRKEQEARNSKYALESRKSFSIEVRQKNEAAAYFQIQVDSETDRLNNLMEMWRKYTAESVPMEFKESALVAISQTQVLISKKFKQFSNLIKQIEDPELKIVPEDLEKFWSSVYSQIESCNERFKRLNVLMENDWKIPEALPVGKTLKPEKQKTTLDLMLKAAHIRLRESKQKENKRHNDAAWIVEDTVSTTPVRGILKTPGSIRKKRTTLTFKFN